MTKKQVLVACGAGIATSTVVNNAIEELARDHSLDVQLVQIKIAEVSAYVDTADLLVTTAMTKKEYPFPVINARSFLTGIGIEETKQQILNELKK
ncbi:PTS sugar transporter subunit IIB [Halalkalibacterium halodurans]|uniref:PTS system, galactitol-specific enzyme II, B component n=1 Tax=Halalkalibacterium halodurans (strain ATCC BAA-125 / DSM 18197 / FERM 7344 / JCM 9153 / C-125) TaxID=272558 RepID=Q9KGB5_HALH5|nr:PTS sugar transporter subunit IIB [Halalkalibacterium halodurans]MED4081290.1 PTS sugar transporter subunit IIB [Halalkalibacterium halodurans]MED4084005.1 PTS sugar transporter subunit IIB [Halalkalibacterium halodurans]MED4105990.1 PTS sugar transporter subunit IIB [Halalkalibacterium halodurans]MED4107336.1 PTS sugar transporter subunit IIB [Halalkalibacterium halodurans]MED4148831.1 PTS sugar transporter subunit IIB [Halalkalibacterium halodurans]